MTEPRCTACNRITLKPAAIVGRMVLGPTCARKAGLTMRKLAKAMRAPTPSRGKADPAQMALELGEVAA
jgi:hypothetical protein